MIAVAWAPRSLRRPVRRAACGGLRASKDPSGAGFTSGPGMSGPARRAGRPSRRRSRRRPAGSPCSRGNCQVSFCRSGVLRARWRPGFRGPMALRVAGGGGSRRSGPQGEWVPGPHQRFRYSSFGTWMRHSATAVAPSCLSPLLLRDERVQSPQKPSAATQPSKEAHSKGTYMHYVYTLT